MVCLPSQSTGAYRPRQPLESDFHRLIRDHFDDFRAVYAERYARKFGYWRPVFDAAVRQFLKCGDLQHGFARFSTCMPDECVLPPYPPAHLVYGLTLRAPRTQW